LGNFIEDLWQQGSANISGTGNSLDNRVYGNSGNNLLSALGGNDAVRGFDGNDTLIGGAGNDTLDGGNGADSFVFAAAGSANGFDRVADFVHGTDQLLFTGSDYGFASGHLLTTGEFTVGATAVGASAQFVWNPTNHTVYWDHDGAGGAGAIAIATFQGSVTVDSTDIHFT